MKLTIAGLLIGSVVAWNAARLVANLLFGLSATDTMTFIAITSLIGVVGLIACYLPARSVMRLDPSKALRYE